jgi:hypothetical protein
VGPNTRQEIRLQFKADRKLVVLFLAQSTTRRVYTVHCAEQVLHMMSDFMGDHISLRKVSGRAQTSFQLSEKRKVDIDLLISGTIKRSNCRSGNSAGRTGLVRKQL